MASKYIALEEAAGQLGLTNDKLNELRLAGQIYGYRDGASWKFKSDDVERLREEMAFGGANKSEDDDDFGFGDEEPAAGGSSAGSAIELSFGDDEILLTSGSGVGAEPGPSSTVVGKEPAAELSFDDEFTFDDAVASTAAIETPKADKKKPQDKKTQDSGDILAGVISDSNASGILADFGASDLGLGGSDVLSLDTPSGKLGGSKIGGSDLHADVLLNPSESQLGDLVDSPTFVKKPGEVSAGSSAKLADDDIFGGPASDVTHRPGDSGILLIDPGDSGLSLEAPLDLGGGSKLNLGGSNLNLGAGGSNLGLGALGTDDDATTDFTFGEPDLKADDDFLLTPLEEVSEDDSDSGSQVIMLDTEDADSGDFGEATATLLAGDIPGLGGMLEEENPLAGGFPSSGGYAAGGMSAAGAATMMVPMVRETPFPGWLVGMLALCTLTVGLSGAMMFDLMLSMWSWNEPFTINSALMDLFVGK